MPISNYTIYGELNDCEDQGMAPTSVCTKFECQTWEGNNQVKPSLILKGKFWCCPKCGSSYGENLRDKRK